MLGDRSWPSADTDSDVQPARRRPQVEHHPGSASAPLGAYAAGPGLVLAMTHQESAAALCNGLSVLATLILCLALIPGQGVDGAALAAAGGLLIRQVLLALAVRARVPIGFTPWTTSRLEPGGGHP